MSHESKPFARFVTALKQLTERARQRRGMRLAGFLDVFASSCRQAVQACSAIRTSRP